jgi:hypothetical protein
MSSIFPRIKQSKQGEWCGERRQHLLSSPLSSHRQSSTSEASCKGYTKKQQTGTGINIEAREATGIDSRPSERQFIGNFSLSYYRY